ncbi:MAG TPA: hypothetical protein VHD90_08405 [Phototrophicaceae bacterium]|nr:hypothetical protein [Phototrophicaceae bacterium]
MFIDWPRVAPVLISIAIIIAIAIVRQYSTTIAAIAATMPLNIPLGMWIVYAGADDKQQALTIFSQAALLNLIPTFIFIIVAWQLAKAGHNVVQAIALGYVGWAISLGLIFLIRALLG